MEINFYKIEVRDQHNNKVSTYLKLTSQILDLSKFQKTFLLVPTLIGVLNYSTEEELFRGLKPFLVKLNYDLYYTNNLNLTYYAPVELSPSPSKELPTSHTTPAVTIEQLKQSNSYKDLTYKCLEKIIERKLYLVGTCTDLVQSLQFFLKSPEAISTYASYRQVIGSPFKSYLLLLRDYFTLRSIDDFTIYYYYNYYNNKGKEELVEFGYYPSKMVKTTKELRNWIKNDRGLNLRANSLLCPLQINLVQQLWQQFLQQ